MSTQFSQAYLELRKRGPFPGQIDPWAEAGRYFQQIHARLIDRLIDQMQEPLEHMGYVAGRETSLLIAERTEPDIYVQQRDDVEPVPVRRWNYPAAAASITAEPGLMVESEQDNQQAIAIYELETGRLVTIIELVSPRNKTVPQEIQLYQERRYRILAGGVNIVEIDLTRSNIHLLDTHLVQTCAYHTAVYLPGEIPRVIPLDFGQALISRIAIPLREEVVPVVLQPAYDEAYQGLRIAVHILDEGRYSENYLPYPTLLFGQRQSVLEKLAAWRDELEHLRKQPGKS